jgi:hypothetical protein
MYRKVYLRGEKPEFLRASATLGSLLQDQNPALQLHALTKADSAIVEALRRFIRALNEAQRNVLLAHRSQLINSSFEELATVIDQAQSVMVEAIIFPNSFLRLRPTLLDKTPFNFYR